MNEPQDYAARFVVDEFMASRMPEDYIQRQINDMERDAIYKAVKQTSGWICIRPEIVKEREDFNIVYSIRVHVRKVDTPRVVMPTIENLSTKALYRLAFDEIKRRITRDIKRFFRGGR